MGRGVEAGAGARVKSRVGAGKGQRVGKGR